MKKNRQLAPPSYQAQAAEAAVPVQPMPMPKVEMQDAQAAPAPAPQAAAAAPSGGCDAAPQQFQEMPLMLPAAQEGAQQMSSGKKSGGTPPQMGESVGAFTFGSMF